MLLPKTHLKKRKEKQKDKSGNFCWIWDHFRCLEIKNFRKQEDNNILLQYIWYDIFQWFLQSINTILPESNFSTQQPSLWGLQVIVFCSYFEACFQRNFQMGLAGMSLEDAWNVCYEGKVLQNLWLIGTKKLHKITCVVTSDGKLWNFYKFAPK